MARTVKVDLLLEASKYLRGARQAERATEDLADAVDDAGRAGERASESTERLGGGLGDLARDARRLDGQIDATKRGIRDLAREIARTSDEAKRADLTKKLHVEQGKHRDQLNLRKLIDFDSIAGLGEVAASGVASSFMAKLPAALGRVPMTGGALANPAVLAIGAPLVAGLVTLVGTAMGGAIVGGAAGLGIVGGLKLAARDPQVQAAGTKLGEDLSSMLGRASASFVPETLGAIDTIRTRLGGMEDDLTRAFEGSSKLIDPLVNGLLDAAENALPGFVDAIDAAGPVIEVVADGIRDLGTVVGEGLSELAPYADEGARALQVLFLVMEAGVGAVFDLIAQMSQLYHVSELIGALLIGDIPRFVALATSQDDAASSAENLTPKLDGLRDKLGGVETKAAGAAVKVETLNEALHRLVDQNVSTEEAQIRMEEAIDRATEAGKRNNAGIDTTTAKGRENRQTLVDLAKATQDVYDRTLEQTGSTELAAAAAARGKQKFIDAAGAMGVEKDEAIKLRDKLLAIPDKVDTKIMVSANTQPAIDSARSVVARINAMHARIRVSAEPSGGYGGSAHTGDGYSTGYRWGGVTPIHARAGLLSEANVFTAGSRPLYAFAEPATVQEAFIPRNGNPDRSLGILSQAARWYGQQVVPAGMASAPAAAAPASNPALWASAIRAALHGVVVQMDGRAVGYIQGREADILSR